MFIDLFNETLTLLGEPTVENLITALQKVNTTFLNQIDWDTTDVIDEEVVNAALDFVGYFLENYGEKTSELRELAFNGECGIIEFTQLTIAKTVKDQVLIRANENMTKKNEFDIEKLKNKLVSLMNEYDDIVVETYGNFKVGDDTVSMSSEFELFQMTEEEEDILKLSLFAEDAVFFIQCGNEIDTMTVYGIKFENKTWSVMPTDELESYMDENWIEEQAEYGYENIKFDVLKDKF